MALKSLSAKYSGVLRIHFTEEREEEAVILAASEAGYSGWTPSFFSVLGGHPVQTQEEPRLLITMAEFGNKPRR